MTRKTTTPKTKRKPGRNAGGAGNTSSAVSRHDLDRLEYHRHAVALMPDPADRYPAIAYQVESQHGLSGQRDCDCRSPGSGTCKHLKQLARIKHAFQDSPDLFKNSVWHRLAGIMTDGNRQSLANVRLLAAGSTEAPRGVIVRSSGNDEMLVYLSNGPDSGRFVERCTFTGDDGAIPTRGDILGRLALLTCTPDEVFLMEKGLRTKRQTFEETFWYRFAYHCHREFGEHGCRLHPSIDESDGTFYLIGRNGERDELFHLPVPRQKVKRVLGELADALSNDHGLAVAPLHLDSVFDVSLNRGLELEIQPMLRLIQADGMHKFFKREDLARYTYGDIYYIKELGMLVEDKYPAPPPTLDPSETGLIQKSRVPFFLAEHDLSGDLFRLDESVQRLRIMDTFDRIEITPEAMERDWCWLSVTYGDGSQSVSLADLMQAKRDKERFVATGNGWVDSQAPAFNSLDHLLDALGDSSQNNGGTTLRLPRWDVLRLGADPGGQFSLHGQADTVDDLEHLLALKALGPMPPLDGMRSCLRRYQQRGAEWLWFLYENGFGGLLCDDMGLGKTHQVMAFLVSLRASGCTSSPALVVCPTSVISHWERKIAEHAPGIRAAVYYGGARDLTRCLESADVLITSYGILRRDREALAAQPLAVAVFDEIQHIKNADTLGYEAAVCLQAEIKLGLTGTPIENSLDELKALLDAVVPGYLGSDDAFTTRYRMPIEQHGDGVRRRQLSRIISPFILRRLKKTVLNELPPKIEDLRTCHLSEEQVKLYRDAVASRGVDLIRTLEQQETPVPYMHIFALLNLLKQICNHPALAAKDAAGYAEHQSGKWDLFSELLSESLDSGQKVVVYSQYLEMIEIIKHHLGEQKVGFAALTGASTKRGEIIARFNQDPDCRVFVGSLKAGGVGIDLVAASVVIHYDRWWNAAREDQATDRVHRIGQTRGVQVFKLVTMGTLEEKIAAIIERKRDLMDSIIKEDDPDLVKTFSRQDLIEMLAMPVSRHPEPAG
jgi:superfamily II DNA or RNA helicase